MKFSIFAIVFICSISLVFTAERQNFKLTPFDGSVETGPASIVGLQVKLPDSCNKLRSYQLEAIAVKAGEIAKIWNRIKPGSNGTPQTFLNAKEFARFYAEISMGIPEKDDIFSSQEALNHPNQLLKEVTKSKKICWEEYWNYMCNRAMPGTTVPWNSEDAFDTDYFTINEIPDRKRRNLQKKKQHKKK